jgi:hypothetical protein
MNLPVGLVKFNWVELFTLRRLMNSMQILPRTLLTKLGKSKPNMLYTALKSRVASRGILAASIVGETPKKEKFFIFPPTHPEINISATVQVFI